MASNATYLYEITEKMFNNSALVHSNIARSKRYEGSNKDSWEETSREGEKPRVGILEAMV